MKAIGKLLLFALLTVNALLAALMVLAACSPCVRPTAIPMVSLLGFLFLPLVLANLAFLLIFAVLRQFRCALLPLIALLVCAEAIHTVLPLRFRQEQPPEDAIKLLSYNTLELSYLRKRDGESAILRYLSESNAHVICLQEYAVGNGSGVVTQEDVNRALRDYPYHRITRIKRSNNTMACYSKLPIIGAENVTAANGHNGAIAYHLKWGDDTLTVVNSHLESNKIGETEKAVYEDLIDHPDRRNIRKGGVMLAKKLMEAATLRAPQTDSIAAYVERHTGRLMVVCGDFNDIPLSYTHHTLTKHLSDAHTQSGVGLGTSYHQNRLLFRIDNILTSNNIKSYQHTTDSHIDASDHYPIWCFLAKREVGE